MSTKDFPFFWDYEQTKQALQELVENRKLFVVDFSPHIGICSNVLSHVPTSLREAIEELMEKWPEFSGDSVYPVPDAENELSAWNMYDWYVTSEKDMYAEGDSYGDKRIELVQYLLDNFPEEG